MSLAGLRQLARDNPALSRAQTLRSRAPPSGRQSNLTDTDSAPMGRLDAHGYRQAYHAQAVVCANGAQLILRPRPTHPLSRDYPVGDGRGGRSTGECRLIRRCDRRQVRCGRHMPPGSSKRRMPASRRMSWSSQTPVNRTDDPGLTPDGLPSSRDMLIPVALAGCTVFAGNWREMAGTSPAMTGMEQSSNSPDGIRGWGLEYRRGHRPDAEA